MEPSETLVVVVKGTKFYFLQIVMASEISQVGY